MPDLPESREALYRLAVSQRLAQRVPAAIETLKQLEQLHPPFGGLFEELGFCLLAINPTNALAAFERAVSLNNCLLESWRALEALQRANGRIAAADSAAARVAQLAALPGEIRLACSKFFDGEVRSAEDLVRQYIAVHGEHVEALRLLAKIAADAGAEFDCELLLQRAAALAPEHEATRHELALVLLKRQKHEAARAQLTKLLSHSPGNDTYRALLAAAAAGVGDYNKALPLYGELLQARPQDPEIYLAIGNALKTTGKTREAIDSYRYAAQAKAGWGEAFWGLANLKTYRFTDAEIAQMQQREASANSEPADRYHLCFALGKALEDRSRFAESFAYYERGNALKKATLRYRPETLERTARAQAAFCTSEFFESRKDFGCASSAPIFIVGLPRSGSTLIEQILASHSQVEGTLELADIPRLAQELQSSEPAKRLGYPGVLGALSAAMCKGFGEKYLWDTQPYRTGRDGAPRPRFTDKMPNNFQYLDLVRLILPNAKILDVRREPMACGFSIFKQLFANGQRFAYSLEDIGRYYRMYVELMAHWERVLPGKILRVQYEEVVNDLEPNVRRILDFCGLEFEPACVTFHQSRRTVHTPSSEQVHQPIFREGIDQWRHFERWLAPLQRALAADNHV
jgi:thioredoxin-like negative regulator of GroEL